MEYSGLTDDELLSRRNQAFLRLAAAQRRSDPRRPSAYDEIRLINGELERRRRLSPGQRQLL
ncbi:MAG: hypothetical protein E6J41_21710 [Chloroflexi bacterium]|nr:MAG: hypothetical protein E6J41_21710 [Chloroflexota bacterium]